MRALMPAEFEAAAEGNDALVLDTRHPKEFHKGFIPGSVNIGLDGDFAPWVGSMIVDVKQPLLIVADPGREEEAATRLSRVGFDNLLGHLKGGFASWAAAGKETDAVNRISAEQFAKAIGASQDEVIDIRRISEYESSHVKAASNRPLDQINDWVRDINPEKHFFIHCAGGYRSMIAASILQVRGYRNFSEVEGGFGAIKNTSVPCDSATPAAK